MSWLRRFAAEFREGYFFGCKTGDLLQNFSLHTVRVRQTLAQGEIALVLKNLFRCVSWNTAGTKHMRQICSSNAMEPMIVLFFARILQWEVSHCFTRTFRVLAGCLTPIVTAASDNFVITAEHTMRSDQIRIQSSIQEEGRRREKRTVCVGVGLNHVHSTQHGSEPAGMIWVGKSWLVLGVAALALASQLRLVDGVPSGPFGFFPPPQTPPRENCTGGRECADHHAAVDLMRQHRLAKIKQTFMEKLGLEGELNLTRAGVNGGGGGGDGGGGGGGGGVRAALPAGSVGPAIRSVLQRSPERQGGAFPGGYFAEVSEIVSFAEEVAGRLNCDIHPNTLLCVARVCGLYRASVIANIRVRSP